MTTNNKSAADDSDDTEDAANNSPWWKRTDWHFVIQVLLFMVGIRVAVIYSGQLDQMIEANSKTKDLVTIAQSANRPYIGVNGMNSDYFKIDRGGKQQPAPPKDAFGMTYGVQIKNFGPIPGENFLPDWRVFMDGIEMKPTVPVARRHPYEFFPTQTTEFRSTLAGPQYQDIIHRRKRMAIKVWVIYDGGGHHETCTDIQYEPGASAFLPLGPCNTPRPIVP
jgi:hypothetical protein